MLWCSSETSVYSNLRCLWASPAHSWIVIEGCGWNILWTKPKKKHKSCWKHYLSTWISQPTRGEWLTCFGGSNKTSAYWSCFWDISGLLIDKRHMFCMKFSLRGYQSMWGLLEVLSTWWVTNYGLNMWPARGEWLTCFGGSSETFFSTKPTRSAHRQSLKVIEEMFRRGYQSSRDALLEVFVTWMMDPDDKILQEVGLENDIKVTCFSHMLWGEVRWI